MSLKFLQYYLNYYKPQCRGISDYLFKNKDVMGGIKYPFNHIVVPYMTYIFV